MASPEFIRQLLPASIGFDAKVQAMAQGVDEQLHQAHELVPPLAMYPDISALATSPERFTPDQIEHFGKHFAIPVWELLDDEQRRSLVRDFYELHRFRGTAYAFRFLCERILRTRLLGYAPPTRRFLSPSFTQEQRAAFEADHPEIRYYPFRKTGHRIPGAMYPSAGLCLGGARFAPRSEALLRIGDKVVLYDPLTKSETDLYTVVYDPDILGSITKRRFFIRLPGQARGQFLGAPLQACAVDHKAQDRVYTMTLPRQALTPEEGRSSLAIKPGLRAMTGYYTPKAIPAHKGRVMFLSNRYTDGKYKERGGTAFVGGCPVVSDANLRVWKTFKLFDPERSSPAKRNAIYFLGGGKLGRLAPHTGELAVDMAGQRRRGQAYLPTYTGRIFPAVSDAASRIERMRVVLDSGRRATDKIAVDFSHRRTVTCNPTLRAGDVVCGQRVLHLEVY